MTPCGADVVDLSTHGDGDSADAQVVSDGDNPATPYNVVDPAIQ